MCQKRTFLLYISFFNFFFIIITITNDAEIKINEKSGLYANHAIDMVISDKTRDTSIKIKAEIVFAMFPSNGINPKSELKGLINKLSQININSHPKTLKDIVSILFSCLYRSIIASLFKEPLY